MIRFASSMLVISLAVQSCSSKPAPVSPARETAPASAALTPITPPPSKLTPSTARTLALSKPNGTALVDKLIERTEQLIERNPSNVEPWISLGTLWIRKARESTDPGYYLNAEAAAVSVLAIDPTNKLGLDLRVLVLENDHRFSAARDLARQIVARFKDDPVGYGNLSDALLELGDFKGAVEAAQQMVNLKPNLPSYTRASYLRWLSGDVAGAKALSKHAVSAQDPRDPEPGAWVIVQTAMFFWHEGDYAGAEAGFDLALALVPAYPPALVGKSRVKMAQGKAKEAAQLLAQAHAKSPLVETAWLLGDARAAAGDAKGAQEAYDRVVKDGRALDHRTLAGFFATKNRDIDEALRLIESERRERDDIYTQDILGWASYRKGKLAEAKAASSRAIALGTPDAKLLFHAGAIRIAAGDASGKALVERALKLNPKFDATGSMEAKQLVGAR